MDFALTDEQKDFVDAIRDFCDRECGTPDQRERLTDGYREHHSFDVYKQMAELGWLGVTIPEEYGGSGGTMLDACIFMEETSRALAPIGGYATTLIVAGATKRFGTESRRRRSSAASPRAGRGDRDDRARGRLRRRRPQLQGRARSTAASSSTARRSSAPTPTSPTTSSSSAAPPAARTSTRA